QALTQAVEFYRAHDVVPALPEPLLLRARTAARRGDAAAALRDLDEGIAAVERLGGRVAGSGVLHVERALFTDAVALALQRENMAAAFAYAERSRGGALTLAALQQRLAGSGTVVLELVTLPEEVVTFAVTADEATVARRGRELPLYEQFVAPVEHVLADARRVIVVADEALEQVAFAAIRDRRGQYLIERFEVAMATSAASLQPRDGRPLRSAAAMALPSGENAQMAGLPETEGELADVAAAYPAAERIPATLAALRDARADVLHIAGHTAREQGAGNQALVFGDGRVSWKTVTALAPLQPRLVVLAACETLRRPAAAETRALSLGAAVAAAGADEVVGTLAPIPDRHARRLFGMFHRHLAAGASAAAALRATQLEAIRSGEVPWKAVALLTTSV
ncbi:MAG TPA: CHAT domain-containing protein, partial [Thermoanaerobaculia bacterium]|nr:CHAT domain-containing protein [Thermoanaerobaculia bacterium]